MWRRRLLRSFGGIPTLPPLSLFRKIKNCMQHRFGKPLSLFLPVASQASRGRRRRRNRKTAKKRNIGSSIPRGRREGNFFFGILPPLSPASHKKRKGLKNRGRESVGRGKKRGGSFSVPHQNGFRGILPFSPPKKNDFANEISCRCINQPTNQPKGSFPSKRQFRLLFPSFFSFQKMLVRGTPCKVGRFRVLTLRPRAEGGGAREAGSEEAKFFPSEQNVLYIGTVCPEGSKIQFVLGGKDSMPSHPFFT